MCAKNQWSCAHPRQALSVTSLVYGTCHLPSWSGLSFSLVSPDPLCTGDSVRLYRKALRWLQSNHFPHRFDNNHLDDLPVACRSHHVPCRLPARQGWCPSSARISFDLSAASRRLISFRGPRSPSFLLFLILWPSFFLTLFPLNDFGLLSFNTVVR